MRFQIHVLADEAHALHFESHALLEPRVELRLEKSAGTHHALPRQRVAAVAQQARHLAVIARIARRGGHLAVARYFSPGDGVDDFAEALVASFPLCGRIEHAEPHDIAKTYWTQVEGSPSPTALEQLRTGVTLGDFTTQPASASLIEEPRDLWPRNPPIRYRAKIPTAWLELTIREGKNRQVRRMTAKVGFPTLRLIRAAIGKVSVAGIAPGIWREIGTDAPWSG